MEKEYKHHLLECFPYFVISKNSFIHYTCNSPSKEVLEKNGIVPIGKNFGCLNELEVLEIPLEVYKKEGFKGIPKKEILTLNLEKLVKKLK
ncbi:MAG: hypothetical protein ABIE36_02080 [Candidatus Diapherotrites archaeon]